MKVLVVEDDAGLAEVLDQELTQHRYQVEIAADGESGLALLAAFDYDLVLLDLRLPKLDGMGFCRQLRATGEDIPILLMTSENTSVSKIAGLDAGADDYVIKPLDMGELLARMRALLRRGRVETQPVLTWGRVSLDPSNCEVFCDEQRLHVTAKEYSILELLLRNPYRIFSLNVLLERLWSFEKIPSENAVRTHVKSLRRKLKQSGVEELIETVYGLGYRLGPESVVGAETSESLDTERSIETQPAEAQPAENDSSKKSSQVSCQPCGNPYSTTPRAAIPQTPFVGTSMNRHRVTSFDQPPHDPISGVTGGDDNETFNQAIEQDAPSFLKDGLLRVWRRHQQKYFSLISGFEELVPVVALAPDALVLEIMAAVAENHDVVKRSCQSAHTLKGALGTFGFMKASKISAQIEDVLSVLLRLPTSVQPESDPLNLASATLEQLNRENLLQLPALITSLRRALPISEPTSESISESISGALPSSDIASELVESPERLTHPPEPVIYQWLIIETDPALIESLIRQASIWGMQTRIAANFVEAQQALAQHTPNVVMLDPACANCLEDGLVWLHELTQQRPSLPVIVVTAQDSLGDRLKVLRSSGGCTFLQKPVTATQVLETVNHALTRTSLSGARILALDDDPQILQCLKHLLAPWGFHLTLLSNPVQFWAALERTAPDLVILDIEMPDFNGLELCQVIRCDPQLGQLPILFLSAHTDAHTVSQVFDVGADDYISKPILGPELVARILNRLERLRLLRKLAETDSLTGLSCRRQSMVALSHLLKLAARQGTTLSLAILDLDRFKSINDTYGHEVGDQVLKTFGDYLRQTFRGEDVVARWGGEEFVVGLYDSSKMVAIQRLSAFLEMFNQHIFQGEKTLSEPQSSFQVSFSAGVAVYPADGEDLQTLYRQADQALYRAKEAGRHRVLPTIRRGDG